MIILLNGSINSGKTATARAMIRLKKDLAHIDVDHLRSFIPWMPLEESIPLNLKNAVDIAHNFHEKGIDSVIAYPLSRDDYDFVLGHVDPEIRVMAVTLFPGLDILKSKRGERELTQWEVQRIDHLYNSGLAKPDFGVILDNSELTIEETAQSIIDLTVSY